MEFIKRFGIFLSLLQLTYGTLEDCRSSLRVPINSRISVVQSSTVDANQSDIIRKEYKLVCDEGYELFGNSDLSCSSSTKTSIGFCAANVSPNRPSNFSSQAIKQTAGGGGVLNDGDVTTCASTQKELNPHWKADLLQVYEVTGIRIHGYNATNISVQDDATGLDLEIRVGNNPISQKNPLCAWKPGTGGGDHLGATEYHSCARPIQGRYVSIQIIGEGILSMCEVSIFATDAIPLQRCKPDGQEKVVNFNGTCFEFAIKNSGKSMQDARSQCVARGGDLASENQLVPTSPSLNLITSILEVLKSNVKRPLFWIGVERDPGFTSRSWRWIGTQNLIKKPNWGKDQPNNYNGEQNCAVLDGGKDWQWNDVGCALDYFHWICVFPPRVCGSPDRQDGTVFSNESKEYLVGYQMYYNCSGKGHFIASGSSLRTCLRSGFWSGQAPKCQFVDCGPEPLFKSITNGTISSASNETFFGAAVSYSCNDGYTLVGDSIRACQKDGKWSGKGSTKCLLSTCPSPPEIVNGTFISTGLKHGSTITYKCHNGHILIGSNVLTCKLGGTYDNSPPICKFIQCEELPTIANGHYMLANDSTVLSSIAQVVCEENYEPSDFVDVYLECRENGRWERRNQKRIGISKSRNSVENDELPGCILITCDEPEVPHGSFVTGYDFTVGSEIQYHCEEGYKMYGPSATRMCDKSGRWTGVPPRCEYVDCGRATAILHGQLTYPNGTTHLGAEVHYSCANNYKIKPGAGKHSLIEVTESASKRVCLSNGLWSGATPSCEEVRCGVPPLPPSTVASVSKNDRYNVHQSLLTFSTMPSDVNVTYKIGTVLKYRCERGYILRGGNLKTCLETGGWSENELEDKLECIYVDCGDPPELAHGVLKLTSNATYFGTTAIYECNNGFKLIGNSRRQCLENSTWSGNFDPHCREITCDAPEKLNTSVDITSFQISGLAKYSCGKGMTLVGNGTRQCTEHGVWSGDPPVCQLVSCPDPPYGDNVRVFQLNGSRYTSVIEYHCVPGHEMTKKSNSILTCTENGYWSPAFAPTCISKDDYSTNFLENSQSPNANTAAEESSSLAVILGLSFGFIIIALVVGLLLWIRKSKMKTRSSSSNGKETRASVPKDQPMVIFPSPTTNQTQSHYYDNPSVDPIYENLDDYGVTSNSSVVGSASVVTINGVSIT